MKHGSVFLIILLASLVEYVGDSSLKVYARTADSRYLGLGTAMYMIIVGFLVYILKYVNVAYTNLQWDGLSAILETLLAFVLLGERLSNTTQYLGAAFIILGILGINYGAPPVN